jgi:hypothetical protein
MYIVYIKLKYLMKRAAKLYSAPGRRYPHLATVYLYYISCILQESRIANKITYNTHFVYTLHIKHTENTKIRYLQSNVYITPINI